jgi:hypothetical protein
MKEFHYLGTWDDSWKILESILQRPETTFIPDIWYDSSKPTFFCRVNDELKKLMLYKRRVYIWAKDFSKRDPFLKRQEGGEMAGKYSVWLGSGGGQGLDLILPACYEENNITYLATGMLGYEKQYLNDLTGVREKPSVNLKAGYKDILSRIKKCLVRHEFHIPIWIGKDGLRLVQEKKAQITGFGLPDPPHLK